MPVFAIEISRQKFLLFRFREFCKRLRGSVGQRAADAQKCLKRFCRIDEDADLCFQWLAHWFERESTGGERR